ncbi:MAG: L-histidine N(alpha)-methyltransferase [Planctomycetales bacterium]|nr:L-histidine N(alpha)-methyltransferase [Planctomycetales bacterium]
MSGEAGRGQGRVTIVEPPAPVLLEGFADAVRRGLGGERKSLPPRFFYDARGSELFERICDLPEYYVTRTETAILRAHGAEIVSPPPETLVELGSGSAEKTRLLLDPMLRDGREATYVPVDLSRSALVAAAEALATAFPGLSVRGHVADYAGAARVVRDERAGGRTTVLLLGSNVGNFDPAEARAFFRGLAAELRADDRLVVGFDMEKDLRVLEPAYDDAAGVTADFNRNVLARVNAELAGEFRLDRFRHVAFYDRAAGRIEMHLESDRDQEVPIAALGMRARLRKGERIHTENSYKFTRERIERLAADSGLRLDRTWTDGRGWFSEVRFARG